MYLPEGCARPSPASLDTFWEQARAALPADTLPPRYEVRWIGTDAPGTRLVFDLILARDKTGTFSLPWIVDHTDQPPTTPGDHIILIDYDGTPRLLVRIDSVIVTTWAGITPEHTSYDGTPVRDLATWIPLHTHYWNGMLAPFGLAITDDMPVSIEPLTPLFSTWPPA